MPSQPLCERATPDSVLLVQEIWLLVEILLIFCAPGLWLFVSPASAHIIPADIQRINPSCSSSRRFPIRSSNSWYGLVWSFLHCRSSISHSVSQFAGPKLV
ncbi:hypothetical protein B0H14DRAFT_2903778, partial [Mycena olivaceomarginata]